MIDCVVGLVIKEVLELPQSRLLHCFPQTQQGNVQSSARDVIRHHLGLLLDGEEEEPPPVLPVLPVAAHTAAPGERLWVGRPDTVHPTQPEPPGGAALVGRHQAASQAEDGQLEGHLQPGVRAAPAALDELLAVPSEGEHLQVHVVVESVQPITCLTNARLDAVIQHPLQLLKTKFSPSVPTLLSTDIKLSLVWKTVEV